MTSALPTGKRSLTLLSFLLKIGVGLEILVLLFVVLGAVGVIDGTISGQVDSSHVQLTNAGDLLGLKLENASGKFDLAELDAGARALAVAMAASVTLYFIALGLLLIRTVDNVRAGHVFTAPNIKRLRTMGLMLVLAPIGSVLLTIPQWLVLNSSEYRDVLSTDNDLHLELLVLGLAIFSVAAVFEYGRRLRDMHEATPATEPETTV